MVFIARHVASGVAHMHKLGVQHRDLKIENVLLENKLFKICDFGSARGQTQAFKSVEDQFEEFEKHTTLMYRPPEMVDKFKGWPVTPKVDVWMLGCIIYTMAFAKHPFMED